MRRRPATAAKVAPAMLVLALLGAGVATATPASAAVTEPDYEMPFPCAQVWTGTTRGTHSPSSKAVDFNRPDDVGDPVAVSAPGRVSKAQDLGSRSYGLHVVIDHGNGRYSLYAHLQAAWVVPGQVVDQGHVLGRVGGSGNVTGPHLHFEQRVSSSVVAPVFHGVRYVMGRSQASANCPDHPLAGDWDGNGTDEPGVFRREARPRFVQQVGTGTATVRFGTSLDQPLTGDWDGDGRTDLAVRRGANNRFVLRGGSAAGKVIRYGVRSDRPVSGDWDGDGTEEIGAFRPSNGRFLLRAADGTTTRVVLGSAGTYPVTGDWNGDGRTDLGAFDPARGSWTLRYVDAEGTVSTSTVTFGAVGDLPVTGDWDGDGRTNLGTWSPTTATYSLRAGAPTRATARVTTKKFGRAR